VSLMNLDSVAWMLHNTAVDKGFWDPIERMDEKDHFIFFAKQLMMIDSEVTEVLEALRKNKGSQQVVEELADILIRVLDLYSGLKDYGVVTESLHYTMIEKMRINESRERLHGVAG
jgi:NTP pyrophosphatase (non-canonical NTP hydrolase)